MTEPSDRVELKTERLLLRPFRLEDADDIYAYAKDPEWERYLGLPHPYTQQHGEEYVARRLLADCGKQATFAIVLDSTVIGSIRLRISEEHQSLVGAVRVFPPISSPVMGGLIFSFLLIER